VPPRGRSEANAARRQDDLSSFRITSASTRRPAATSASESRNAACSAARSASSSQSPGSSGRSSISVPSGRSVGSSTTSRPAQTRAFRVIDWTLALTSLPNKPLERPGTRAVRHGRACERAGRSTARRCWAALVGEHSGDMTTRRASIISSTLAAGGPVLITLILAATAWSRDRMPSLSADDERARRVERRRPTRGWSGPAAQRPARRARPSSPAAQPPDVGRRSEMLG
jgi:hypothetical protein